MPRGFEELKEYIFKHSLSPDEKNEGLVGLLIVFIESRTVETPRKLLERDQV